MFRKLITTWLLLTMAMVGTGGMVRMAQAEPVAAAAQQHTLPAAPASAVAQAPMAQQVALSNTQMSADRGGFWGWLKKLWNKYKKKIIKIIWQVIQEIINSELSETTTATEGVSGTVTESYEGTDVTETVYASQADYDANNVQSESFTDGGYSYVSTDYSAGCYCSGEF